MYITIFKLIWPYVGRHLADYAAGYLQERRERRLQQAQEQATVADCPPCPPCPPAVEPTTSSAGVLADGYNTFWFTLSGLVLGGAFGLMLYVFVRDRQAKV
jgi:hypothetical protein